MNQQRKRQRNTYVRHDNCLMPMKSSFPAQLPPLKVYRTFSTLLNESIFRVVLSISRIMIARNIFLALVLVLAVCKSEYRAVSSYTNSSSFVIDLVYTGSADYYIKPASLIPKKLTFILRVLAYNDFDFKMIDPSKSRFEVPQGGVFPLDPLAQFSFPYASSNIVFTYTANPFDFEITRKVNKAVLFSTYQSNFIYSDYYLEIGTEVESQYVYGLGERFMNSFKKPDGKWTIFNRDRGQVIDEGTGRQTYGYYPVYMMRERNKFFHLNYLRNSNAMDVIKQTVTGKTYLIFKVIGGIFDFRFFLGDQSPELTLQKMHLYNGRSEVPPFWAMGFHQCKWGYKNSTMLLDVIRSYRRYDLPLDTIWSDIDYMIDYEDFTIDQTRFPLSDMKEITDQVKYIPIIDAGIKTSGAAYKEGIDRNVFIKDANGSVLVGRVWPGDTAFVDFFHPNATKYWTDMLNVLYSKVKFGGVWLDMNQYANFCDGACVRPTQPSTFDYSKDLPYQPGEDSIESHTIPLNSTHYGNLKEADVHAFAALLQTAATNSFLKSKNLKPVIISRSSTMGSSKYGFHWTGDNYADWSYLRNSIAQNFNNQLWGFQMVGPDICGFGGNTTVQLCARWFQIGSLYPFARSHNAIDSIPQEPYALGPIVMDSARNNLRVRYTILKHYYSTIVNKKGLGSIFRPVFFLYPFDNNLYVDEICDTQFMIGNDLLAAPILYPNTTTRKVYFPQSSWYDLYNGIYYPVGTSVIRNGPTDLVPLFLREGAALMLNGREAANSTRQLSSTFTLYAGVRYDPRRSNNTHKYYDAVASILSIKDYADEAKIDLCVKQTCEYIINMVFAVNPNTRSAELDIRYNGGSKLNELIRINNIFIMYEGKTAQTFLEYPVEITGTMKTVIPINDNKAHSRMPSLFKGIDWEQLRARAAAK